VKALGSTNFIVSISRVNVLAMNVAAFRIVAVESLAAQASHH
jgi:hypothetical protein